jgi:hypothetical protein
VSLLCLLGVPACAASGSASTGSGSGSASEGTQSSSSASDDDDAGCLDAATFTFRASCGYIVPSDAGALSACDEWSQGGANDWGVFIEGCIQKNGDLSAQPCATTGQIGECRYAASCTSERVTYAYGASGAASFAGACTASVGATWAPM